MSGLNVSVTEEFSKQFDNIDDVAKLLIACREISTSQSEIAGLQDEIKKFNIEVDKLVVKVTDNKAVVEKILKASGKEVVYVADNYYDRSMARSLLRVYKITYKEGMKLQIEEKDTHAFVSAENETLVKLLAEEIKDLRKKVKELDAQIREGSNAKKEES